MAEQTKADEPTNTTRYLIEVEDARVQVITFAIDVPEGEDPIDTYYGMLDDQTEEVSRRTVRSNWEVIGSSRADEVAEVTDDEIAAG